MENEPALAGSSLADLLAQSVAGFPDPPRLWIGGHNMASKAQIHKALPGRKTQATGPLDLIILTPLDAREAAYFLQKHGPRLVAGALCLIVQPRPVDPSLPPMPFLPDRPPAAAERSGAEAVAGDLLGRLEREAFQMSQEGFRLETHRFKQR